MLGYICYFGIGMGNDEFIIFVTSQIELSNFIDFFWSIIAEKSLDQIVFVVNIPSLQIYRQYTQWTSNFDDVAPQLFVLNPSEKKSVVFGQRNALVR